MRPRPGAPSGRRAAAAVPVVAVLVVAGLVVAGLVALVLVGRRGDGGPARRLVHAPTPEGTLAWEPCGPGRVQCATLAVPRDHARPDGEQLELAVARLPAGRPGQRVGTLAFNPGGPGVPGTGFLASADALFARELRDHFDVVTWDPRGTGRSAGIDCVDDLDPYMSPDPTPDDAAERAELVRVADELARACRDAHGDLLAHVSTQDSARDLDALRRALGEEQLSVVGFSYGSELAATWATLFPSSVRAVVLDGALDPSTSGLGLSRDQALGNELSLQRFLDHCARGSCAFARGQDPGAAFDALLAELDRAPVPARGASTRPRVGQGVAYTAVIRALYDRALWPVLDEALDEARSGDGAGLLALYDAYLQRRADGSFTDVIEAFTAISCLDDPVPRDLAAYERFAEEMARAAPRLGRVFASGYTCARWSVDPVPAIDVTAAGAGPVLVLAATGDPATPYEASRRLVAHLAEARLVTRDGDGHTSYEPGRRCVAGAVHDYLLELRLPAPDLVCRE